MSKRFVRTKLFWKTKIRCPHCRQPMPETRLGVMMPPIKASIYDLISRRGEEYITALEIQNIIELPSTQVVRQHVWGINRLIIDTDWRIKGGNKYDPGYKLVRKRPPKQEK